MAEEVRYKCNIKECNVETDGKCYKGHADYKKCPHYNASDQIRDERVDESDNSTMIDLQNGSDLDYEESLKITRRALARVIVLAGAVSSGKTTLIACIYEKFLRGHLANYIFAGSKTLLGFEKRCHLARIVSGRTIPDTERTKKGFDEKLLHLKVRPSDCTKPAQDLLFSDISGETFKMAINSVDECRKLSIIKRADHFVLVIDGEQISSLEHRQSTYQDAEMLLRRCIEAGMIGKHSYVDVLFTKYDLIKERNEKDNLTFINYIEKSFRKDYEKKLEQLNFNMVASRPKSHSSVPLFYGFENIFPNWVEKSPFLTPRKSHFIPDVKPEREYDKFYIKYIFTNEE